MRLPLGGDSQLPRRSAIDVRLPELADLVDTWRRPTVPDASRGMPPHITLLYPWRPAPVRSSDIAEAVAALDGSRTFSVTFRHFGRFPNTLFLRPDPDDGLRALIRRLTAAFPDTPPYGGRVPDPLPHLTVAKVPTEGELSELADEVTKRLGPRLPLTVTIHELAIDEEGPDGTWSVRSVIPLVHVGHST